MFNKVILFVSAIICMAGFTYAQELQPCSTDENYHELLKQYPQLADMEEQFNAQLRQKMAQRTTADDTTIYDVPLVIHIVHDYGAENINDTVIYNAVKNWAIVYMKQNADTIDVIPPFVKWIGNPRMRLHLATKDPDGNPTKGVTRIQSYLSPKGGDQAKYDDWPNNKYINIWFINTFDGTHAGAAAYANYPSSASFQPYYDGVIGLYSYINQNKAIPHEIGHILNLQHVWGNTNNAAVACGNDQVDDTPPTKGHNPSGCTFAALYDTACSIGYTAGSIDYPDTNNSQNIMDYTYCDKMFTKGQVTRMRAAITSSTGGRNNLITPANVIATGINAPMPDLPPVADFVVNKGTSTISLTDARTYFLTYNNTVQFTFKNWSWNDTVSSVQWTFSNGATNPTSTSMTTVTNKFSTPGWVTVSLQATSNAGSNTITNTHAVYAADTIPAGGSGYSQKFASAASIDNWPMFNYYNNTFKWEYYSGTGYDDGSCVRYRSFDASTKRTGDPRGDKDDIYTPAFDLSEAPESFNLYFYTAAASISGSTGSKGDSLQVDFSTTGGQRWTKLVGYTGADLANNGVKSTEFTPASAANWKLRTVKLSTTATPATTSTPYIPAVPHSNQTFFRFRYWPGNTGNNLYLDNFSIDAFPTGVRQATASSDIFRIFPNPASNGFNLVFKTGIDGVVNYSIKDITGKLVYEHKSVLAPYSLQQETISRSTTPSAGMYFVTVTIDGVQMTQKLVVY